MTCYVDYRCKAEIEVQCHDQNIFSWLWTSADDGLTCFLQAGNELKTRMYRISLSLSLLRNDRDNETRHVASTRMLSSVTTPNVLDNKLSIKIICER